MRARLSFDRPRIAAWLCRFPALPRYPRADEIVVALELEDPARLGARGYVWYSAMTEPPRSLCLHLALDRRLHGRWTREVLHDIERIPYLLGHRYLFAGGMTPPASAMARAAGWQEAPGGIWYTELPGFWGRYHHGPDHQGDPVADHLDCVGIHGR
jgi:hypothetical protein